MGSHQDPSRLAIERIEILAELSSGYCISCNRRGQDHLRPHVHASLSPTLPNGAVCHCSADVALVDQWYVSLREDLKVMEDSIAVFSGAGRPRDFNEVNLMVINTAREFASKASEQHDTMLIVDECHRAASSSNAQSLNGNHKATLGISATPRREYDDLFNSVLVPALGPVIYKYEYDQAFRDGVIVPFDLVNVSTDMTSAEQQRYDDATLDISRTFRKVQSGGRQSGSVGSQNSSVGLAWLPHRFSGSQLRFDWPKDIVKVG